MRPGQVSRSVCGRGGVHGQVEARITFYAPSSLRHGLFRWPDIYRTRGPPVSSPQDCASLLPVSVWGWTGPHTSCTSIVCIHGAPPSSHYTQLPPGQDSRNLCTRLPPRSPGTRPLQAPHLCSVLKMANTCLLDMKPFSTSRILRLSSGSMYFFSFS